MFGLEQGRQWETMAENYALLHRLWREEGVTWSGTTRPDFEDLTTLPCPYHPTGLRGRSTLQP